MFFLSSIMKMMPPIRSREAKHEKVTNMPYFSTMYIKAIPMNKPVAAPIIDFPVSFKSFFFIAFSLKHPALSERQGLI